MNTDENRARLRVLAQANTAICAMAAAIDLEIADLLGDRALTSTALAEKVGANPTTFVRLLRGLSAVGLLAETAPDTFALTPAGSLLSPDHPESMSEFARLSCVLRDFIDRDVLREAAVSGRVASTHGTGLFEYLSADPALSECFNMAMRQSTIPVAEALPKAYDFSAVSTVLDIGGGNGTLLIGLLAANASLRGMLCDTVEGVAQADETLGDAGVADRCTIHPGNIIESIPAGADVYIAKSVLEDWPEEKAVTILTNCRRVMAPTGRLLIVEPVLPDSMEDATSPHPFLMDLMVMTLLGGQLRTRRDFERICARAGFAITDVRPLLPPDFHLIEAVPVQ